MGGPFRVGRPDCFVSCSSSGRMVTEHWAGEEIIEFRDFSRPLHSANVSRHLSPARNGRRTFLSHLLPQISLAHARLGAAGCGVEENLSRECVADSVQQTMTDTAVLKAKRSLVRTWQVSKCCRLCLHSG